jgi:hypothetical protein
MLEVIGKLHEQSPSMTVDSNAGSLRAMGVHCRPDRKRCSIVDGRRKGTRG